MIPFVFRSSNDCPCKNCDDRAPTCHDICEKYGAWKKKVNENRQVERDASLNDRVHFSYVKDCYKRNRRR